MTRVVRLVVGDNIQRLSLLVHDLLLAQDDVLGVPGVPGVLRQRGEVSSSLACLPERSPVASVGPERVLRGWGQVAGLGARLGAPSPPSALGLRVPPASWSAA